MFSSVMDPSVRCPGSDLDFSESVALSNPTLRLTCTFSPTPPLSGCQPPVQLSGLCLHSKFDTLVLFPRRMSKVRRYTSSLKDVRYQRSSSHSGALTHSAISLPSLCDPLGNAATQAQNRTMSTAVTKSYPGPIHQPANAVGMGLCRSRLGPWASVARNKRNRDELTQDIRFPFRIRALHCGQDHQLGSRGFDLAHDLWSCLLCRRDDAHGCWSLRSGPSRNRFPSLTPSVRCDDCCWNTHEQDGTCPPKGLRSGMIATRLRQER